MAEPKFETKLKIPDIFDRRLEGRHKDCQFYDAMETAELQKAVKRIRGRIKQTMVRIVKENYNIPQCTMDALYTLDDQLTSLGHELKKGGWMEPEQLSEDNKIQTPIMEQFADTPDIDTYVAQMSKLEKLGEILKEPVTQNGDTLYDLMCEDEPDEAEKDFEILQNGLFIDGTDLLADDITPYSEAYGPKVKGDEEIEKTAAEWIAECKEQPFITFDIERKRDFSVPARIIAARQLSEAERGKKGKLGAIITEQKLLTRAAMLENDDTFRRIMRKQSVYSDIDACLRNPRSHGGALEDIMKREICKLGPGRLPNKPLYERYMPTVKERIEALQKMAKNGSDMMKLQCAAEIVVLREMCGAQRGKVSSLKVPVPVDELGTLRARVAALVVDRKFKEAVEKPEISAALQNGHGGRMVELIDAQLEAAPLMPELGDEQSEHGEEQPEHKANEPESQNVNFQSVGNQMKVCSFEAIGMVQQFGAKGQLSKSEQNIILEKGKYLLADYILLDGMSRDPKNPLKIDDERLNLNAGSQQSREERVREGMQKDSFQNMTENMNAKEMLDLLRVMAYKKQPEVMEALANKELAPKEIKQQNPQAADIKEHQLAPKP